MKKQIATPIKPSDVLKAAHEYMTEAGWCRGQLEDDNGHVCLMGALHFAARGQDTGNARHFATQILQHVIQEDTGKVYSVAMYNDGVCKRKATALNKLKKAYCLAKRTEDATSGKNSPRSR